MDKKDIERINYLYKKSKTEFGLSDEEKEEQSRLRGQYLKDVKANFRKTLENIEISD